MGTRNGMARSAVAAVVVVALAWVAYGLERPVPILDWFDLAVHEAGHLLAFPLPEIAMFLAGSVLQVAVPLGLAWYFWITQRDRAAVAFCLAWSGTSARDVAVYVADARAQQLPLVGGGEHDWAFILRYFDALDRSESIAGFVAAVGAILLLAGLVIALVGTASRAPGRAPTIGRRRYVPGPRTTHASQPFVEGDPWYEG